MRAVAGIAIAALVSVTASGCGGSSGVARARATLNNDHRFGNGPSSTDAFASIASDLLSAGHRCRAARHHDERGCLALFEAAAAAETTGGFLGTCTAPNIFAVRAAWRPYLESVARYERHPADARPRIPQAPTCD